MQDFCIGTRKRRDNVANHSERKWLRAAAIARCGGRSSHPLDGDWLLARRIGTRFCGALMPIGSGREGIVVEKLEAIPDAVRHAQQTAQIQLSCSVCWQEFDLLRDLDEHIRDTHPDRIIDQYEFLIRSA